MKKAFYLFVISVLFLFSSCENLLLIEATQLYEVTFESNGGTPVESYRTNCIEKSPVITKEDATFSGWFLSSDFSGDILSFPYEIEGDTTLYAKWIQRYTVHFISNGGTEILSYKTDVVEAAPDITRDGYYFAGWYEASDFGGEPVQFPCHLSDNKNFYAKWIKICHVSFETNGGSEVPEMETAIINEAPDSSRIGYLLLGWYKEAELQNQISFPYFLVDDAVFYAKWTAATNTLYKVEHYKQNSVIETNHDSYILCDSETMAGKTASLTQAVAKTYEGFTVEDFSQVPIAADGSTVVRIYYGKNKYTVSYKVRHYKQTTSLGTSYELAEEDNLSGITGDSTFAYAKAYYGFTEKTFSQSIIDESGNTVVNIYYDRNKYTVSFNANSGSGTMSTQTFYFGVEQKIRSCSFSKSGYIFSGWSDSTNGLIKYTDNEKINVENNKTLYATWFYGTAITNEDIRKLDLTSLSEDYLLRISGQISHSTLEELAKKIVLAKVNITLDLSNTQGLTTISPDNSNKSIFSECKKLTSIILPNSLTTIGNRAFYNCKSLTQVLIPSSVRTIGSFAFAYCENLTSLELDGVETIGPDAFYHCSNMKTVYLKNINTIGYASFNYCSDLSEVKLENINSIGDYCFGTSPLSNNEGSCKQLSSIILKDIGTIGYGAFAYDRKLSSVVMQNVSKIDELAFTYCSSLTSITIDAVTIAKGAFKGCTVLTSVIIGKRVTEIQNSSTSDTAYYVFGYCNALTSVSFEDTKDWFIKSSETYSYKIDVTVAATNATNLRYAEKPWIKK